MKAVNSEMLLQDYEILAAEQAARLAEIERQALSFANSRGYNAERAEEFIAFVKKTENNGLTEQEKALFDVLGKYIYEVEPETEAAEAVYSENTDAAEANNGETVN